MEVYKFGGASVKDAEGVRNLAKIIKERNQKNNLLIVISAMGKITNKLEELTKAYLSGLNDTHQIFEEVKGFHFNIISELFPDHTNPVYNDVANSFVEIDW